MRAHSPKGAFSRLEAARRRLSNPMDNSTLFMNLLVAVFGGAVRVGTPFLMVSLAECITEKSGRINLGLEGVLVFSAMAGFGGA